MQQRTKLLGCIGPCVHRNNRNTGSNSTFNRRSQRIRIRDRNNNALRILVDCSIDQLRHLHHVECFRRAIIDLCTRILGGFCNAILHNRPERIRCLTVAHNHNADILCLRCERRRHQRDPSNCRLQKRFHVHSSLSGTPRRFVNLSAPCSELIPGLPPRI
ncbi:hypothetical protein D9M72_539890 [compost metagenome]